MKKSLLAVMVAGMMTVSLTAPCVWASEKEPDKEPSTGLLGSILDKVSELGKTVQDSGVVDSLFGEEGALKDLLPEDVDVNGILDGLQEKISFVDGTLIQNANELFSMVLNEDGKLDSRKIEDLIGSLIAGAELESTTAPSYYRDYYEEANEAINRHLLEETAEYLEPGDESIISRTTAEVVTDEDGTIHILGYFQVTNYDADGTDLVMKNYAGNTELLTLTLNENGIHDVTSCVLAEDGEDYSESVEALCEAIGITPDVYYEAVAMAEMGDMAETITFLDDHPEYKRVEYAGELLTSEEMDQKFSELLTELFFSEEDAEAEATLEAAESVEETEAVESAETVESTEAAESAEEVESTEAAESAEDVESIEAAESAETASETESAEEKTGADELTHDHAVG